MKMLAGLSGWWFFGRLHLKAAKLPSASVRQSNRALSVPEVTGREYLRLCLNLGQRCSRRFALNR